MLIPPHHTIPRNPIAMSIHVIRFSTFIKHLEIVVEKHVSQLFFPHIAGSTVREEEETTT
jgi:hypothetical protein